MASGNAGKGRPLGARNRLTREILAMAGEGLTPVEYCLEIMRDQDKPADLRLSAAKIVAPYLHPRPIPQAPTVEFELPENLTTARAVQDAHFALIQATAKGTIAVALAKDLSALFETQRRVIETTSLEERISRIEQRGPAR